MKDITKKVKSLEKSSLFIKGIGEIIKNKATGQKRGIPEMLLGSLGASLLGNWQTGKGRTRASGETIRADQDFNAASSLTNFEIQKYCQNEPKFNGLCDSKGIRTHNHLVQKQTLNHLAKLAKWLSCAVGTECGFTLKLVRDMIIT